MFRFISAAFTDFFHLLYPTPCLGCQKMLDQHEMLLCVPCRMGLPETSYHLEMESHLLTKFAGKVRVAHATSFYQFSKGSVVQKLIHQIKYKDRTEAAVTVGQWYGHRLQTECPWVDEIDLFVGVPLHKKRLRKRGYNQADCIAEGLSKATSKPMRTDVMVRTAFRESQTRKNRLQRWLNVKTVFRVSKPEAIIGKHVAIVDDVLTTGATIEACAIELHRAGCKAVSVITIASAR
ncbi:ComF family protein [Rudanella paleaurantiibacter]|nr:phosphoribosyltransferase family protein [Rudanella paleaurantiibacter]